MQRQGGRRDPDPARVGMTGVWSMSALDAPRVGGNGATGTSQKVNATARRANADPVRARSPLLWWLAGNTMRHYMRRNFHAVRVSRPGAAQLPPERPVIVYTNHPSWWDPALIIVLATTAYADRPAYAPIDAAALDKYRFMRRIGLFGVDAETRRGAAQFLRTSLRILKNPKAMLWITAEGGFTDPRVRPVRLRPGVAHLARKIDDAVIVPLAIEYPFWDERYPEALCRFGEPLCVNAIQATPGEWRQLLEARLTTTMDALATQSLSRDPAGFDSVIHGAVGVGGVYDLWRRARARLRGERFSPEHGDSER